MHNPSSSLGDGIPEHPNSPGIAIPPRTTPSYSSTSQTVTGCGCRCGGCSCSSCFCVGNISVDDSNRTNYSGQGTTGAVDALVSNFSRLNVPSIEAQDTRQTPTAPSLELLSQMHEDTPAQLAETRTSEFVGNVDDAPWLYFLERSMTSDATEISGMFFPMDLESSSMENNATSSGTQSMLSSYMSAMSVRSEAASAIVQHAGAALATPANRRDPYLRLL